MGNFSIAMSKEILIFLLISLGCGMETDRFNFFSLLLKSTQVCNASNLKLCSEENLFQTFI